ncbi:MAG: hypothetical protein ACOX87_13485 [Chloroflexota bacterium]|jgi:hypothetical protein
MAETVALDTLRTICAEVPEARVIVIDCCQTKDEYTPKDGFNLMLAVEPVHYVIKEVSAEQLADTLREIQSEGLAGVENICNPSVEGRKQQEGKRTVVVLKVDD